MDSPGIPKALARSARWQQALMNKRPQPQSTGDTTMTEPTTQAKGIWMGRAAEAFRLAHGTANGVTAKQALVVVSVCLGAKRRTQRLLRLQLSLHPQVLDLTGWQAGDNLDLCCLTDGTALLVRDPVRGHRLKPAPQTQRLFVSYTVWPELNWRKTTLAATVATDVATRPNHLSFVMPREVFGR